LSDVVTGKPDAQVRFELFPLQQNAELFITNLGALLKRDFIGPREHWSGYNERHARRLMPCGGDRKIESAIAGIDAFESQITDVLLHVFHNRGFIILNLMTQDSPKWDYTQTWKYHNATKHSEWSIRASPHYLDWSNQPIPLKIYTTLDPIQLPQDADQTGIAALSAISAITVKGESETIPGLRDLARLLYFSAGITKKKTFPGGEMYFRAASCTGALYEFELYLVCGDLPDLKAGVYHFGPGDFALRLLRAGDYRGNLAQSTPGEPSVTHAPAVIICAGTYWRNAWKYRTRTYRHFGWDNGTLLANLLAMAAALRLPANVVLGFVDSEVNALLDLDADREVAFSMVSLGWVNQEPPAAKGVARLEFPTVPLSQSEIDYPELREMHEASSLRTGEEVAEWRTRAKAKFGDSEQFLNPKKLLTVPDFPDPIEQVILRRGSTRKFAREPITRDQLSTMLQASTQPIWSGFPLLNDLYLIVNAVDGVAAGAYYFHSDTAELELLKEGNFRDQARYLGLQQDLPGDAAADVFFLADLNPILGTLGNRGYRATQLEAGIIGGRLYLAAYALRLGATGLTFFDDDVTQFFSPHAGGKSAIFLIALGKSHKAR
jgi:SagB-type dehydrogenase family enzyme